MTQLFSDSRTRHRRHLTPQTTPVGWRIHLEMVNNCAKGLAKMWGKWKFLI